MSNEKNTAVIVERVAMGQTNEDCDMTTETKEKETVCAKVGLSDSSDLLGAVHCSFCGRNNKETIAIIRADDCAICDKCVIVCVQTIIDSYGA